ncbi:MAG: hypothetical protein ACXWAC_12885 [Usitatibacter sp.]
MSAVRARLIFGLWFAALATLAGAQELPRASAALRVATLAERIAKLHAQLGLGVLVERSRRALPEALRELDASVAALTQRTREGEIRDNYVLLGILAKEYRQFAAKAPSRENARKLSERAEEIAWVATKNARLTEERMRTPGGTLALHAAQAGMLAQRVARLHLMRRWGHRDEANSRELGAASEELRLLLERLGAAPQNTPEIAAEIQVSQNQFMFLAQAASELESGAPAARQIEFIAKTGDNILESMERAVRLYEALAR